MTETISHEIGQRRGAGKTAVIICMGCGLEFPAEQHPVERDQYESPEWVAHVLAHRSA